MKATRRRVANTDFQIASIGQTIYYRYKLRARCILPFDTPSHIEIDHTNTIDTMSGFPPPEQYGGFQGQPGAENSGVPDMSQQQQQMGQPIESAAGGFPSGGMPPQGQPGESQGGENKTTLWYVG